MGEKGAEIYEALGVLHRWRSSRLKPADYELARKITARG